MRAAPEMIGVVADMITITIMIMIMTTITRTHPATVVGR